MADRSPAEKLFDIKKARLRHAIVLDRDLTGNARVVGYLIADLMDFAKGYAWPPQEYLAEQLGLTVRTVHAATRSLAKYFEIQPVGRNRRYHPKWSAIPEKSSGKRHPTPEKNDTDTGKKRHQTPEENTPLSFLPTQSNIPALADINDLDPGNVRWTAVKARVARLADPGQVRSWVAPLRFRRQSEFEVVLVGPSAYACSYLEANAIGDRILDAWRAEVPSIRRVIYITERDAVAGLRAAE